MPELLPQVPRLDHAALVVVDVQERLVPAMADMGPTLLNIHRLIRAFGHLDRPVLVTEQYPRGLGPTVRSIQRLVPRPYPDKTAFSCYGCQAFSEAVAEHDAVILCGIEAHVCVLQTALAGLARGQAMFVAADAVTSRAPANRERALRELGEAGVTIASTETLLFQLLGDARAEAFRPVSRLVR